MKVLELCFALDHYNYAWWLSVFVQDLEVAYGDNPELFSQSQKPMLSSRGSSTIISIRIIINALSQQVSISIWLIRRTNRTSGSKKFVFHKFFHIWKVVRVKL